MTLGGKEYELPVELPIEAVAAMGELADASKSKDGQAITASLSATLKALLGDDYDEFMSNRPSVNDLSALVEGIPGEYGINQGESSGSDSPTGTGARSKPRSKPTTE